MWVNGVESAKRIATGQRTRLELLHGKPEDKLPPAGLKVSHGKTALGTAARTAADVPHVLAEYMGRLHTLLKTPAKEAAWANGVYRRTQQAIERGEDVTDPVVQFRISNEAYLNEATRDVSMNDNIINDGWKAALNRLERKGEPHTTPKGKVIPGKAPLGGPSASAALKILAPVMKAPTNLMLEALHDHVLGLPIGGVRACLAYMADALGRDGGVGDLSPVERDSILRQINRGLLGTALIAFYLYKMLKKKDGDESDIEFGGFYQHGEKRKAGDVPADALRVGETTIPKMYLGDSPLPRSRAVCGNGRAGSANQAPEARCRSGWLWIGDVGGQHRTAQLHADHRNAR